MVFKQMRRVADEALETEQLKRARVEGGTESIFELDDDALLIEQNRLRWMLRWLLPAGTVLVASILILGHFVGWTWSLEQAFATEGAGRVHPTGNPTLMMWFVIGIGFISFLYARYAVALSRLANWRLLRAGAACMAGNAIGCLILAFALMATSTIEWAEPLASYAVRILLVVLGVEFTANFVLDFYRPRSSGVIPRPSFDSRLLGLISEPGGIAKSIAETMNYQFGFEVSSTWFYQLLQRWLFPITVATFIAVISLSSVVVIDADEQAVVERFGRVVGGNSPVLSPGLHLKLPYPIDVVYRAPVNRISEVVIGESEDGHDHADDHHAIVWTEAHDFVPEMLLLVAAGPVGHDKNDGAEQDVVTAPVEDGTQGQAVSLLMVSIPIEYRIKDIEKYLHNYEDPETLLEQIAYRYLTDYASSVDVDELIGPGRNEFNVNLHRMIQTRIDELELGIEIVFAGVSDAHPPAEGGVAASFQYVISAETGRAATINTAKGMAQATLIGVAGTVARAKLLDKAIQSRNKHRVDSTTSEALLNESEEHVIDLLMGNPGKGIGPLYGKAASIIAEARSQASRNVSAVAYNARIFSTEVAAYEAAPELYKQRKMLQVYEDIDDVRKYIIVGDTENLIIIYETSEQGGLDRVLTEGLTK
ncbi:hypothetical protein JYU10_00120 [bacterium AH-315-J04]|nr:hypothetical protein [bacterium AH-315-J04]